LTVAACAALVARGDPDRFAAVMTGPVAARARLFPLFAFNLEVARAPWVTAEPLIAEMRLQWWRDVVDSAASGAAKAHEVAEPLWQVIREAGLPVAVLDALIAARRADIGRGPPDDLEAYLADTAGGLMWLAAKAVGAAAADEAAIRGAGWAAGLASYLRAVPDLVARGRVPLDRSDAASVAALAREGLARWDAARGVGRVAAPALRTGWQTRALLARVVAAPEIVAQGHMRLPEVERRGRLVLATLRNRW